MKKVRRVTELKGTKKERRIEFYKAVDEQTMNIQQAVLHYRYMLGMNQVEFAKFTEVPLKSIRDFEQGKSNPTIKTIEKMLTGSGLEIGVKRA